MAAVDADLEDAPRQTPMRTKSPQMAEKVDPGA